MSQVRDHSGGRRVVVSNAEQIKLQAIRQDLHRAAEVSGREKVTADILKSFLKDQSPDKLVTGIGGFGLAAVFEGTAEGPTVLLRADMDALPIPEDIRVKDNVVRRFSSHKCGHDGHMAILCGVAMALHGNLPRTGKVVLLFQPSEETGEGAIKVLADAAFQNIGKPNLVFALHNLPGYPKGQVITSSGPFASASRGMVVELTGMTAHAAEPQKGKSPALAVSQMIQVFSAVPQYYAGLEDAAKVTVIHASLGEPEAFGTSPGSGVVKATLRSHDDEVMKTLVERCSTLATGIASANGLGSQIGWTQMFPATKNCPNATRIVENAASELGLARVERPFPFPWSEDFGHFTSAFEGALFGLGAGVDHPGLHNPNYEFPDDLIPVGVTLFDRIVRTVLGNDRDV